MRARWAIALTALLLAGCEGLPRHKVVLAFDETGEHVTVTAETETPLTKSDDERAQRLRDDLLAWRDEWSLRFANTNPESDRMLFERERGRLVRAVHTARINADDLPKFFFDLPLTISVIRGKGWMELNIVPGTPNRATRQQRDKIEKKLELYAHQAVTYFSAVRAMYAYLEAHPDRAEAMFVMLFRDSQDPEPELTDDEDSLVDDIRSAIQDIALSDENTERLEQEADMVFNPLPATLVVRTPGETLIAEGFTSGERGVFVAETKSLIEAVALLQGRWISPDPLAVMFRASDDDLKHRLTALAAEPRRAEAVIGEREVADALRQRLRPAERYRVRFRTRDAPAREP